MAVYSLMDMPTSVADAVRNAARAEAAGLHRYMVAQVERADCVAVLAVVADRVPRIELATAVMAIQSTLPQYVAQQARTLNQISEGRFTLGLGVSHEPIAVGVLGLEWDRPYRHMVEYLDAVLP
ncbi:MAG: LLM class flavin-dependent oxidoreductase, partial [Acidimicrobiaceae bacterium]|nr:LLM class flavin-dependent oxidoreductase [Acidimicrobiaceae bacterium]